MTIELSCPFCEHNNELDYKIGDAEQAQCQSCEKYFGFYTQRKVSHSDLDTIEGRLPEHAWPIIKKIRPEKEQYYMSIKVYHNDGSKILECDIIDNLAHNVGIHRIDSENQHEA